jgi:hypothetical protein
MIRITCEPLFDRRVFVIACAAHDDVGQLIDGSCERDRYGAPDAPEQKRMRFGHDEICRDETGTPLASVSAMPTSRNAG